VDSLKPLESPERWQLLLECWILPEPGLASLLLADESGTLSDHSMRMTLPLIRESGTLEGRSCLRRRKWRQTSVVAMRMIIDEPEARFHCNLWQPGSQRMSLTAQMRGEPRTLD
jgi:hypothetical protein